MATPIRDYKDLTVWQVGLDLCETVYRLTRCLPESEKYGLCSQLRRAASSISINIAEGYGRGTTQDYIRFLRIARGSAAEVETELIMATRLGLLDHSATDVAFDQLRQVRQLLQALIRALEK